MPPKSYKGFILWLIGFLLAMVALMFIPGADDQLLMRLVMLLVAWGIAVLTFIIWRTEQVYWYNGTSYEEAVAAGSERRKEFAWKHFRLFGLFALLMTVVSCGTHLLDWSAWIDFTFGTVGICATAFGTIPIKL